MPQFEQIVSLPIFANSMFAWSLACTAALAAFLILLLLRRVVRRYHARLLVTDRVELLEIPLEALARTSLVFFGIVAIFILLLELTGPGPNDRCQKAIEAIRRDGRVLSVHVNNGPS